MRAWDRTNKLENKSRLEQAARFIYLNKTGFNGLFRVNSQNQINVPYGKYKNPAIVNEKVLLNVSQYLNEANVQILNGDYADAVKNASSGDFVYFDPPYAPVSDDKSSFVGYTLNGFSLDDQIKLSEVFKELDKKGVKLMLSNSDVPFIRDLYKDFKDTTKIVQATRNINSNAAGRGKVGEVIVMNY
ncbi:Type II DNA restriction-modification system methylase [Paucilactobacillus oligofermentans DSM 15707 = LMG 22743]|nr:Type II DNA restriction-modification system methylase [Paucilactobacillus oligofermentans DSM 15707 = LMG 22743]